MCEGVEDSNEEIAAAPHGAATRLLAESLTASVITSYVLAQAEVSTAPISEAVAIPGENHHFFDVCELFESSINFCLNTSICADSRRGDGTTEFQCCSTWFWDCALLVQCQREIGASDRQGC